MADQSIFLKKQKNILIVEKDDNTRQLLQKKLTEIGYLCFEAIHLKQTVDTLNNEDIALVILNVDTQGLSILPFLASMKANYPYTAIIVATPVGSTSIGIECMNMGADEYITKPLILEEVIFTAKRVLERRWMENIKEDYQQYLKEQISEQTEKFRNLFFQAITSLVKALEAKDGYTIGHSQRVSKLAVAISLEMSLPRDIAEKIRMAGLVHDIGKIGIKDSILNKSTGLTDKEMNIVQTHSEIGEHILTPIVNDKETLKFVRNHHERLDGKGYPDGLTDTQIPLGTKILTVADAFDAMTSDRPYRKAMTTKTALIEIGHNLGTQFDSEVAAVLERLKNKRSPGRQRNIKPVFATENK